MQRVSLGIIMNGVTGRMGKNQHLLRSLLSIREEGGLPCGADTVIWPEPVLTGRNPVRLRSLAEGAGGLRWSTDLDSLLSDTSLGVYFDAQTTVLRAEAVRRAILAGKHVYCEKPAAVDVASALELFRLAEAAGVKHGVVQDKLWLPGIRKLQYLVDTNFFGRVLSVRGEFGYWVFDGISSPAQRPSWNYRKSEGGGIILDMLSHWRYVIDALFGRVVSLSCLGATHIPRRRDEAGDVFEVDTDDAAYATFLTATGTVCHFNSSWTTRVRRDDLLVLHVDGERGSAVAGLRECRIQPDAATPRPVWNPDVPDPIDYWSGWSLMPDREPRENAFKAQWKLFLSHVAAGTPFRWNLLEGAKGVQLAELGIQSWRERCWIDVPELG